MTIKKTWPTTQLLNISVDCCSSISLESALIAHCHNKGKTTHLVTMNAEMAYMATQNTEFNQILTEADIIIPDGIGVVWGLKHQGVPVKRMPGVELVESLFRQSQEKSLKIYLLGSSENTLNALESRFDEFNSPLIVGRQNGYFEESELPKILEHIRQAEPDILFVSLGVPKQEEWIRKHKASLNIPLIVGVGGSFDVLSGQLKRAPLWMQKSHLEWLYRLKQQPSRCIRMLALPKFVLKVLYEQ